jgi:hypothetical protein
MQHIQLGRFDYLILIIYFVFVIGIGWVLKRRMKKSTDFLLSLHPGLGDRPGFPFRQPRRAGSHRHGRLGRQVRHHDQPFLLGGRDSGDGVRCADALRRFARQKETAVKVICDRPNYGVTQMTSSNKTRL